MKKHIYILFALACLLFFPSCNASMEESLDEITQQTTKYADLVISMNTPGLQVASRTIANDPENEGNSWTTWEKFVDGTLLYHVTLFVVDSNGTLVGYRNIYEGSDDINLTNGFYENSAVNTTASTGVEVKATFISTDPMHGDIEKLRPGNYKLVAVANYSSVEADGKTYAGLGKVTEDGTNNYNGIGDFPSIVSNIIDGFSGSAGLADFTQTGTNGATFFTYQLNSGVDRVCKLLPQALVMVRNVTLQAGTNQIEGLLSRTFARVRLDVKNNDASAFIGVSNLSFNGAYASQNAYLFNDVAAGNANLYPHFARYEETKGTLTVTSEDAITTSPTQMEQLPAGVSYNILDCYILEGQIVADYAFSFTASYWTTGTGGNSTKNYRITDWGPTGSTGDGSGLLDYFVFIRTDDDNSRVLFKAPEKTGNISTQDAGNAATDNSSTALDPSYIWEIIPTEKTTSNQMGVASGYLQSIGSSLYLQAYDGGEDKVAKIGYNESSLIFKINFRGTDELGSIYSEYNGSYYYLNSSGEWTTSSENPTSDNQYERITFETIIGAKGEQKNEDIKQVIEMHTYEGSTPTNEIRRNDFFWGTIPVKVN